MQPTDGSHHRMGGKQPDAKEDARSVSTCAKFKNGQNSSVEDKATNSSCPGRVGTDCEGT